MTNLKKNFFGTFLSWNEKVHLFTTKLHSIPTTITTFNQRSKSTEEITRRFKERKISGVSALLERVNIWKRALSELWEFKSAHWVEMTNLLFDFVLCVMQAIIVIVKNWSTYHINSISFWSIFLHQYPLEIIPDSCGGGKFILREQKLLAVVKFSLGCILWAKCPKPRDSRAVAILEKNSPWSTSCVCVVYEPAKKKFGDTGGGV